MLTQAIATIIDVNAANWLAWSQSAKRARKQESDCQHHTIYVWFAANLDIDSSFYDVKTVIAFEIFLFARHSWCMIISFDMEAKWSEKASTVFCMSIIIFISISTVIKGYHLCYIFWLIIFGMSIIIFISIYCVWISRIIYIKSQWASSDTYITPNHTTQNQQSLNHTTQNQQSLYKENVAGSKSKNWLLITCLPSILWGRLLVRHYSDHGNVKSAHNSNKYRHMQISWAWHFLKGQ